MRQFEASFDKLTPAGSIVSITMKAVFIPPFLAKITYTHQNFVIGSITCQVGDMGIYQATDFILDYYFESPEFEQIRKEGGAWN